MKKLTSIFALTVLTVFAAAAEDQGPKHSAKAATGAAHSNAPVKARAASTDRDKGTARAKDVGHGKKTGLNKQKQNQAKQKNAYHKRGKFAWLKFPGRHKKQS